LFSLVVQQPIFGNLFRRLENEEYFRYEKNPLWSIIIKNEKDHGLSRRGRMYPLSNNYLRLAQDRSN
jgi:thiamine pyrophosphokinase